MPRPPLRGEVANRVLRFRLMEAEYSVLTSYARAESITVTQLIAEAVAEYCSDLQDSPAPPFKSRLRTFINSLNT